MHFTIQISHRLNKLIRSLQQKKFRDQNSLFVAEGYKLCNELMESDFDPELVVVREYPSADVVELAEKYSNMGIAIYSSPKNSFDQITNTKTPEGILAVINKKENELNPNEPFIALDSVNNPGNVGTIIRTAEWFGIKQVLLGRDCADKYNPKVVRASMGSFFRSSIDHQPDLAEFIKEKFRDHTIYGATVEAKKFLQDINFNGKFGIIFGSESHGISPELMNIINETYTIKGFGKCESLNVSMAAGISLYHYANAKV